MQELSFSASGQNKEIHLIILMVSSLCYSIFVTPMHVFVLVVDYGWLF